MKFYIPLFPYPTQEMNSVYLFLVGILIAQVLQIL